MTLPALKTIALATALVAGTAGTAFAATATASVNVRTGPSVSYRVIDTLRPGERVTIDDRAGGWCHVIKSGPDGWVSCRYLTNGRYDRSPRIILRYGTTYPRHDYPRDYPHNHGGWDNGDWNDGNWHNGQHYPSAGVTLGFGLNVGQ